MIIPVIVLLYPTVYLAQNTTGREARKQAGVVFNQKYDHRWQMRWDHATDTPASLLGHRITKYGGSPQTIARSFMSEEKVMLGIKNVQRDLRLTKTNVSTKGGTRLIFTQVYNGVPVLASGYLIAVDNTGGIYFVSGDYYPDIIVDTKPALSESEVIAIIESDLMSSVLDTITEPVLYIKADVTDTTEEYILVYQADASTSDPLDDWRYTIDANSGEILVKKSLIERINWTGDVCETNPNHGGVVTRTIHRLRNIWPRKLDGDNVIVLNDETSEAYSHGWPFSYSPNNTHFDEVMAYYHSDEFEAWLIGKGMETNRLSKVTIHTHNSEGYAFYLPSNGRIYFSDGTGYSGLRNPTKEAAVINHEYMHAVSETYNDLRQNNEADAMDESYSDYFGLAYKNQFVSSSIIGEYIDEPGGLNYTRNLVNTYNYSQFGQIDLEPNGVYEEHDNSVIFSGALWDFRRDGDVNASVSDELVLESLNNLGPNPTFLVGREALEAAASLGYSSYLDDIADAFHGHGIGDPWGPARPTGLAITNAGQIGQTVRLSWNANTEPTLDHYNIWRKCQYWVYFVDCKLHVIASTTSTSFTDPEVFIAENDGTTDNFTYYVSAVDGGGNESDLSVGRSTWGRSFEKRAVHIDEEPLPDAYRLEGNYPNPFNPLTTIQYALPEASQVNIVIYDLAGREVRSWNRREQPGYKQAVWDGRDNNGNPVSTGVYIYTLTAQSTESDTRFTHTRKMVLLR